LNERLMELYDQAIILEGNEDYVAGELDPFKFAELIVRECVDWIDGSPTTDAGQLLLSKSFIIANLKGHFGVEK